MEYLIFKNPKINYRNERFGGLVKIDFQMFILNKEQYKFLKNLKKYIIYNKLSISNKKIVDILLNKRILLKIDENVAKKYL